MKEVTVLYYEAFTDTPHKGNPAGIVYDADYLTDEEMQKIASRIGFNETAFILTSNIADLRIRYFTPGHEMNLCGHGTVAAVFSLMERNNCTEAKTLKVETLAGVIEVIYDPDQKEVHMSQANAEFIPFEGDISQIAYCLGIVAEDIDEKYPIVYGSTGIWTLIVPIRRVESFMRMNPTNKMFPEILSKHPYASIHPICLETYNKTCQMHGRHFSSPRSGTVEDPVTGTASGVMGAYYITYMNPMKQASLIVEQGYEIGKKGIVNVFVAKENGVIHVSISGKAVYIDQYLIEL